VSSFKSEAQPRERERSCVSEGEATTAAVCEGKESSFFFFFFSNQKSVGFFFFFLGGAGKMVYEIKKCKPFFLKM
jgi:hypothetical protein